MRRIVFAVAFLGTMVASSTAFGHASAPAKPAETAKACAPLRGSALVAERRLRGFEVRALGPSHARAHALARRYDRCAPRLPRGTSHRQSAIGTPAEVGVWTTATTDFSPTDPTLFPVSAVHMVLLPTGKILVFHQDATKTRGRAYIWNPTTSTGRLIDMPANFFCAGQTLLSDGRVLIAGGQLEDERRNPPFSYYKGLNQIWTFNPFTETLVRQPNMRHGRWYPTLVRLPDGRVMITQGADESGDGYNNPALRSYNDEVEVFTPSPDLDGVGTVAKVGDQTITSYYPHQWLLPSGKILSAGPGKSDVFSVDPAGFVWTKLASMKRNRYGFGSGVLLPGPPSGSSRVLMIGGNASGNGAEPESGDATTELFDAGNPGAGWSFRASLPEGRKNLNAVILPDGKLLAVGGNNGTVQPTQRTAPVYEAALYDPADDGAGWRPMAGQNENRAYHSTAVLLPDGRVLSGGDDGSVVTGTLGKAGGGPQADVWELFEPPNLFIPGARPVVSGAPAQVGANQPFTVAVSADVSRLVLVAPGAVTHANDTNQRHVELEISGAGTSRQAVTPGPNVAPPGYYMLFGLNAAGEPSVARWIRVVGPSITAVGDLTPPVVVVQTPASGATGVATTTQVSATFSEALDASSVNAGTFSLRRVPDEAVIGGQITASSDGLRFTLTPATPLAPGTTYRMTIGGVRDVSANALATSVSWTFATAKGPATGPVRLAGTAAADVLRGGSEGDVLRGLRGNDRLFGRAGDDRLFGGLGADLLVGGPGKDRLFGGPGDDRLVGGPGADILTGDLGRDQMLAGPGNDLVVARDGVRDVVICGPGRDAVIADPVDRTTSDCESVRR